jgi:hypothetical protein
MEPSRLMDPRAAAMDTSERNIEEVITGKTIAIARNKAGRQAFMNNAPVDNFGSKVYQYVPLILQVDQYR